MAKGIYCYIDKKDNQIVYVGKDSNIDKNKRHRKHFSPSKYDVQPINRILQNNPDRYIYQILWEIDDCTDNHLNQMEIFYIKKYDPQFNFTEGGDGISGFKHSEESRKKISESLKGKKPYEMTEEIKKKISESLKGKKPYEMTEETKKKMSKSRNTTGFYKVSKEKRNTCKQGFIWVYTDQSKSTRKRLRSTNLLKLQEKVEAQGLPWEIVDEEKAKKSLLLDDV